MTLRTNDYRVLERAVDEGVAYGYQRAFKYNDKPTEEQIKSAIVDAVLNEICEWFVLDSDKHVDDLK